MRTIKEIRKEVMKRYSNESGMAVEEALRTQLIYVIKEIDRRFDVLESNLIIDDSLMTSEQIIHGLKKVRQDLKRLISKDNNQHLGNQEEVKTLSNLTSAATKIARDVGSSNRSKQVRIERSPAAQPDNESSAVRQTNQTLQKERCDMRGKNVRPVLRDNTALKTADNAQVCTMLKGDKCNSMYAKGIGCDGINSPDNCPYREGCYAMAVADAGNRNQTPQTKPRVDGTSEIISLREPLYVKGKTAESRKGGTSCSPAGDNRYDKEREVIHMKEIPDYKQEDFKCAKCGCGIHFDQTYCSECGLIKAWGLFG